MVSALALGFLGWGWTFLFLLLSLLFSRSLLLLLWRGHAFASRLLLLHGTRRRLRLRLRLSQQLAARFCCCCCFTGRCSAVARPRVRLAVVAVSPTCCTFSLRLRPVYALLLTATSLLNRLLLNWNRRLRLWRALTLTLVSHLELLSLRAIRRRTTRIVLAKSGLKRVAPPARCSSPPAYR